MANNVVNVLLSAQDNMSPVIERAVRAGTLQAALLGAAFNAAAGLAQNAFGKFTSAVSEAAASQGDLITSAGALRAVIGGSFDAAYDYAGRLNEQFARLGAQLPGTAEDFAQIGRTLTDNVATAFQAVDGSFDKVGFEDRLTSITQSVGVLAAASKTAATEAGMAIARVLDGDSGAFKLLLFDKNPVVKSQITKALAAMGKDLKDWGTLTQQMRLELLDKALTAAAGPEVIDKLQNTVDGILSSWKSNVFDPTVGTFGMLRKLAERGGSTALDALQGVLVQTEQLFEELRILWPFKRDPMVALFDAFNTLTKWLSAATGIVEAINVNLAEGRGLQGVYEAFGAIPSVLAGAVKSWVGKLGSVQVDTGAAAQLLSDLLKRVMTETPKIAAWVSGSLIAGVNRGMQLLVKFLENVKWVELGVVAGETLGRTLVNVVANLAKLDWGGVARTVGTALMGAYFGLMGVIVGLFKGVLQAAAPLASAATSQVGQWLGSMWQGITSGVKGLASAVGETVTNLARQAAAGARTALGGLLGALRSWFEGVLNSVNSALNGLIPRVTGEVSNFVSGLGQSLRNAVGGMAVGITGTLGSIGSAIGGAVSGVVSGVTGGSTAPSPTGATGSAPSTGLTGSSAPGVWPTFRGWLPTATSPRVERVVNASSGWRVGQAVRAAAVAGVPTVELLSAAVRERRAAPGHGLLVANTSEMVLTPKQQAKLGLAKPANQGSHQLTTVRNAAVGTAVTVAPANLTVNMTVNGANEPATLARAVLAEIDALYRQYEFASGVRA